MIGIIAASDTELAPVLEKIEIESSQNMAMLTYVKGKYHGLDVVCVYSGVCKVNAALATQLMISKFKPTQIIMVGVCGAMDERLNLLDIIVSNKTCYHDVSEDILTDYHPWMPSIYFDSHVPETLKNIISKRDDAYMGLIVTGESFITTEGRDGINALYKPLGVDMESASVAHVCYANACQFTCIRAVSDTPRDRGIETFEDYVETGSKKVAEILFEYLASCRNND